MHKQFLADVNDEDMIRTFANQLDEDLPKKGSIIVFNEDFESRINGGIGKMYNDLKDKMDKINDRMVDIMKPFEDRVYYSKGMQGSYSLKYVLPALYPDDPELDYSNLSLIHHGGEASGAFENLKDKTPEEQKAIKDALYKYCGLDTYALVKILEKFKEVTKDNF